MNPRTMPRAGLKPSEEHTLSRSAPSLWPLHFRKQCLSKSDVMNLSGKKNSSSVTQLPFLLRDARLTGAGYAVLRYSARGFGASWGQTNLADVNVEGADLRSMIGQAIDDPRLAIDGSAVAVFGASYGGAHAWLGALDPSFTSPGGRGVTVRTVIPVATWSELLNALVPNGRPEGARDPTGAQKFSYVQGFFVGGAEYAAYVRGMDGSLPVRLGKGLAIALSPDGTLAVVVSLTLPMQAVLLPTGAGTPRPLPRGPIEQIQAASFLPDGRRIVLCASEPGKGSRLYLQDIQSGEPRPLGDRRDRAAQRRQRGKDVADAGVHVGDRSVVLRDDIVLIRAARREPAREEIAEGLECVHLVQRVIRRIQLISAIESAFKGRGGQIRRVWVHMP